MIELSQKILFTFLILTSITCAQLNTFNRSANEVIEGNSLRSSGRFFLSDIFEKSNSFHSYTADGFRWKINSVRGSKDQSQNWLLMLDGHEIFFNTFGIQNINMLPVSTDELEKIEIITTPQNYNGEFSGRGIINLITQRPESGISFYGNITTGNETGDPGPYRYTDFNSENIDVIGPNYNLGIKYGGSTINAVLNYKANRFLYPTPDKPVGNRLSNYEFKYRKLYSDGLSSIVDLNFLPGRHKIITLYSTTGKYNFLSPYGADLIYFEPAAIELPIDSKFWHAGINGSISPGNPFSLNYSVKASLNKIMKPDGFNYSLYDRTIKEFSYNLELLYREKTINYSIGSTFNRYYFQSNAMYPNTANELLKFYSTADFKIGQKMWQSFHVNLTYNGNIFSAKNTIINRLKFDENKELSFTLSFLEYMPDENSDYNYLGNRENYFPVSYGNNITIKNNNNKSRQFNVEFGYEQKVLNTLKLKTELFINRFSNFIIRPVVYTFNKNQNPINAFTTFNTRTHGAIIGYALFLENEINHSFQQSLNYRFTQAFSGEKLFREENEIFPNHRLKYNLLFVPEKNLTVGTSITYLSKSEWTMFRQIEKETEGLYLSSIPSKVLVDLSFQKTFWKEKLHLNLLLKNLFNRENRSTPYGAYFDFSLFLTINMAVNWSI